MLSCPTCGPERPLHMELLEAPSLRVDHCANCDGLWIPVKAYSAWLDSGGMVQPVAPDTDVTSIPVEDGPFLRRCPQCAYILGRYRVDHDLPFTIDRCHNCRGVWLDRHEWRILKAKRLHERIHAIFTQDWQEDVRKREEQVREMTHDRRTLGDTDYARVLETRSWIAAHPHRDLIWGLLLESRDEPAR